MNGGLGPLFLNIAPKAQNNLSSRIGCIVECSLPRHRLTRTDSIAAKSILK